MTFTTGQIINVAIALAIAVFLCYKVSKGVERFSGAFDPSVRLTLSEIGPQEGYCNNCI